MTISLDHLHVSSRSRFDALLSVMADFRAQYKAWLADPVLPFVHVLNAQRSQINPNPYVTRLTHFGVIETLFPNVVEGSRGESIEIINIKYRTRLSHATHPYVDITQQNVPCQTDITFSICAACTSKDTMRYFLQV